MTIPNMNPLGYTGLKQRTPANAVHYNRDPTVNDYQNYDIGDLWVNTTTLTGFQLVSKSKNPVFPHNTIGTWIPSAARYEATQFDVVSGLVTLTGRNPNLPAFLAYKSASTANATGNGTQVNFICDTEFYDQTNNYNAGTGTFTAPVDGIYQFFISVKIISTTIASVFYVRLATTARTYTQIYNRPPGNTEFSSSFTLPVFMLSGETCYTSLTVVGEIADSDTVYGGAADIATSFAGYLIC